MNALDPGYELMFVATRGQRFARVSELLLLFFGKRLNTIFLQIKCLNKNLGNKE